MKEQLQTANEATLSPEQQEQVKRTICDFFEGRLAELEVKAGDDPSKYVQQFYELCTGSNRPWTQQKEFDLPGLPMPFRIRLDRHSGYQPELQKMSISIEPLLQAQTPGELKEATLLILGDVYHETEHIFFPVELEEYEDADRGVTSEEWVKYACQSAEINANARQFAFLYSREYPNELFTLGTMRILAEHLKPKDANAYNYFIAFAKPDMQEKYRHIANLAQAHELIITQTKSHLEKLKQKK